MGAKKHRDAGRGKAHNSKSRRTRSPQVIHPTFSVEPQRWVAASPPLTFTAGSSKFIGRVGALAVALGIGVLVTNGQALGVAYAEPGTDSSDTSSTSSDTSSPEAGSKPATDTAPPAGQSSNTNSPSTASTPPSPGSLPTNGSGVHPTSPADQATAPQMQTDNSGGANTSTNDAGQLTDKKDPVAPAEPDAGTVPPTHTESEGNSEETTEPPAAQDGSTPTETPPSQTPPSETPLKGGSVHESQSDAKKQSSVAAHNDGDAPALASLTSTAHDSDSIGDQQTFSAFTADTRNLRDVETFRAAAAESLVAPETVEQPRVGILQGMANAVDAFWSMLSPYLAPNPTAPAGTWMFGDVISWFYTGVQRTFFNRDPVINDQTVPTLVVDPGGVSDPIAFGATDGDGDPLTYTVPEKGADGGPQHGTVTIDQATGTFVYDPDEVNGVSYTGPDEFTVTVSDYTWPWWHSHGLSSLFGPRRAHTDVAEIKLNVESTDNDAPTAVDDAYTTDEDTPLVIAAPGPLGNDTDPDGDTLTAALVTGPTHGTLTGTSTAGAFTYTPDADFAGRTPSPTPSPTAPSPPMSRP